MKKILIIVALLLLPLSLISCDNSEENDALLDVALSEIKIGYQDGDSETSVTRDLELPVVFSNDEVSVTWLSNHEEIISTTGQVTRPLDEDTVVELTLKVQIGESSKTQKRPQTVLKVDDNDNIALLTALNEIAIGYQTGNSNTNVTKNITLPTTTSNTNVTVTWTSNNTSVISNTGVVTRQSSDTVVTLTVKVQLDSDILTKDFLLTVVMSAATSYEQVNSIADIYTMEEGALVEITGVVIEFVNFSTYILQDAETGIVIIDEDSTYYEDLNYGFMVTIKGLLVTEYSQLCLQIDTLIIDDEEAEYDWVEFENLNSELLEQGLLYSADFYDLHLVNTVNVVTDEYSDLTIPVIDSLGNEALLLLTADCSYITDITTHLSSLSTSDSFYIEYSVLIKIDNIYHIFVIEPGQIQLENQSSLHPTVDSSTLKNAALDEIVSITGTLLEFINDTDYYVQDELGGFIVVNYNADFWMELNYYCIFLFEGKVITKYGYNCLEVTNITYIGEDYGLSSEITDLSEATLTDNNLWIVYVDEVYLKEDINITDLSADVYVTIVDEEGNEAVLWLTDYQEELSLIIEYLNGLSTTDVFMISESLLMNIDGTNYFYIPFVFLIELNGL